MHHKNNPISTQEKEASVVFTELFHCSIQTRLLSSSVLLQAIRKTFWGELEILLPG